jgi:hypothetical protein
MQVVSIIRPDQNKIYSVMPAQKMVMTMSIDPEKMKQKMPTTMAGDGKFDLVGPDTVDGVACLKYKMTAAKDNKVFYWWISIDAKIPVKMAADDGSITLVWKNYKAGPQDPSLFEVPAGYQVMEMPSMPGGAGQ